MTISNYIDAIIKKSKVTDFDKYNQFMVIRQLCMININNLSILKDVFTINNLSNEEHFEMLKNLNLKKGIYNDVFNRVKKVKEMRNDLLLVYPNMTPKEFDEYTFNASIETKKRDKETITFIKNLL